MFYVIEKNLYREKHYNDLIDTLHRMDLPYEIVSYVPFSQVVPHETKRTDVWVWGSASISPIAYKYNWKPGSQYNDNHNFEVYAPKFGMENMLNGDGVLMKLGDKLPEDYDVFFARPAHDTKAFSGTVYDREEFENWQEVIRTSKFWSIDVNTPILVAPPKNTQVEVRCWVVNGKVISTSRYKLGSRVTIQNYDHETGFMEFAQSMVDKYQPADCFVLDVCLWADQYKIVEVNCINCSGFYQVNFPKLITAIEDFYALVPHNTEGKLA